MNHPRTVFLAVALLALAACQPKSAPSSADTSPPVATVNGTPISRDFYEFYIKGITGGKASADLTAQQRSAALDNLIRARLVGEEATKEGLDKSGDTALPAADRASQRAAAGGLGALPEGPEADRAGAARRVRDASSRRCPRTSTTHATSWSRPSRSRSRSSRACDKGEKFDDARQGNTRWTPPRTTAATSAGSPRPHGAGVRRCGRRAQARRIHAQAVQTQYGWHVIQLLETRELTAAALEQVRQRLEQMVQAKKFRAYTDELMRQRQDREVPRPAGQRQCGAAPRPRRLRLRARRAAPRHRPQRHRRSAAPPAAEPAKN